MSEPRIYHGVPENLQGERLYPLNRLAGAMPEIFAAQAAKYSGREELMKRVIPKLNCLWNDVLQFSTVHPLRVGESFREAGFDWRVKEWFEIDPLKVGMNESTAVIYTAPEKKPENNEIEARYIEPFTVSALARACEELDVQRRYLAEMKRLGERPLLFQGIPHLLFHGELDLRGVTRIWA